MCLTVFCISCRFGKGHCQMEFGVPGFMLFGREGKVSYIEVSYIKSMSRTFAQ